MRLDPDHVRKLERAFETDGSGNSVVKLDIPFLRSSMDRLTLWEGGLLMTSLMRAAKARRRTDDQRTLLALFVHDEYRCDSNEAPTADDEHGESGHADR